MQEALLEKLRCPCCGGGFTGPDGRGLLGCECDRYPIVGEIAVLRSSGADVGAHVAEVAAALARGQADVAQTLALQLTYRGFSRQMRWQRMAAAAVRLVQRYMVRSDRRRTGRLLAEERLTYAQALAELRPPAYGEYLLHRYANTSFLSAVTAILLLGRLGPPGGRPVHVLDLACGSGHASFLIRRLLPGAEVVAADFDFLGQVLYRDCRGMRINSIYRPRLGAGQVRLEMHWPSRRLEAEHGGVDQYSPRRCTMSRGLWDTVQAGCPDGARDEIHRLARRFVLVHLPEGY